jgi:predicted HTH transcriptional regulator
MDNSKIERINSFIQDLSVNDSFIHPDFYLVDSKLKIYEDEMHEFKQFTILEKSELVEKIRNLSKYLCAFLNSNSGVIYLGINDDGYVKGIRLTKEMHTLAEFELSNMITLFDAHVNEKNLIMYQFCPVHRQDDYKIIDELYVIEILVKQGLPDMVYTTPFKDPRTNDYECFIKLNGTKKKIEGPNLYKYLKNKIKNYVRNKKNKLEEKDDFKDEFKEVK